MPRERRGEMAGVAYSIEWMPFTRELTLKLMTRLMPAVRITSRGKWAGRAREYVNRNNAIRDIALLVLREHELLNQGPDGEWLPLFDKATRLWLRGGVYFRRRGPEPDTSNFLKACEDALQGVLYNNDRQIQEVGFKKTRVKHDREEGFWIGLMPMPEAIEEALR